MEKKNNQMKKLKFQVKTNFFSTMLDKKKYNNYKTYCV